MRHAREGDLDAIEPTLAQIRAIGGLKEKQQGTFYRGSNGFLHFHIDAVEDTILRVTEDGVRHALRKTPVGTLRTSVVGIRRGHAKRQQDGRPPAHYVHSRRRMTTRKRAKAVPTSTRWVGGATKRPDSFTAPEKEVG